MKFFATLLLAATVAVASAQEVPACPATLIATATGSDEAKACTTATGFSAAVALKTFPTAAEATKICANVDCQKLLKAVTNLVTAECDLAGVKVKATLVDKFAAACSGAAAGTTEGGAAKAGSGSGASSAEVTTPAPTTQEASAAGDKEETAAGSTAGSGAASPAAETVKAVPTPAPTKSSASTVAAATGAVVMAVAATML